MVKNTNTEFLDTKKHKHNARKMTDFLTLFPGKKEQPVSDNSTGRKLNSKKHIPPPKGIWELRNSSKKKQHIKMVSLDTSWFISIWPVFSLKGETESIPCNENISALRKSKVSSGMTTSFTSAEFEGTSRQALGCPGKKETALVELSSVSSSSLSSYLHHNGALLIFIN